MLLRAVLRRDKESPGAALDVAKNDDRFQRRRSRDSEGSHCRLTLHIAKDLFASFRFLPIVLLEMTFTTYGTSCA